jgi:hypothetical protein
VPAPRLGGAIVPAWSIALPVRGVKHWKR